MYDDYDGCCFATMSYNSGYGSRFRSSSEFNHVDININGDNNTVNVSSNTPTCKMCGKSFKSGGRYEYFCSQLCHDEFAIRYPTHPLIIGDVIRNHLEFDTNTNCKYCGTMRVILNSEFCGHECYENYLKGQHLMCRDKGCNNCAMVKCLNRTHNGEVCDLFVPLKGVRYSAFDWTYCDDVLSPINKEKVKTVVNTAKTIMDAPVDPYPSLNLPRRKFKVRFLMRLISLTKRVCGI